MNALDAWLIEAVGPVLALPLALLPVNLLLVGLALLADWHVRRVGVGR
jgi:hypothetical protein